MPHDETVTLPEAVGRLAVSLAGWIVPIVVTYYTIRIVSNPDFGRTVTMKVAQRGERYCMRQAQLWASRADRCTRVYDTARQITL